MKAPCHAAMLSLAVVLGGGIPATQAKICPFLDPPTFAKEIADAKIVIFGKLYVANAERKTTEVAILAVLKDHPGLKNKKHVTIKRYVPLNGDSPKHYVILADYFQNQFDAYRGFPCAGENDDLVKYVENVMKKEKGTRIDALAFYFRNLEHRRPEIAQDAFRNFYRATFADLKAASRHYDSKKLESWLADKDVPEDRKELYRVLQMFGAKKPAK